MPQPLAYERQGVLGGQLARAKPLTGGGGLSDPIEPEAAPVLAIAVARPTLDDVFLHLTGRSLREDPAQPDGTTEITSCCVSPLSRPALLIGRALKEVVPMLMQVAIIIAVVTPFSFDLHLDGVLVAAVMLSLFSIGIGAASFALALASKGQDWMFWTVQQTLLFPTLLTAGVLLPMDGAPRWLEIVSRLNPMTYVVDATRTLFSGTYPADIVMEGFAGAAVVTLAGLFIGVRAMRRSN